MLGWIHRGLSSGRVTTGYPRVAEPAPGGFLGAIVPRAGARGEPELAAVCPTGAISVDGDGRLMLDRGLCLLCGECVRRAPQQFVTSGRYETAARSRAGLVSGFEETTVEVGAGTVASAAAGEQRLASLCEQATALSRSIHVRHIDCGSDGSEEWEIQALWNPYYDIQRLGFQLTAAPRHADLLLVTGPVTAPMREPLLRTWAVMGEPKVLVAVGTDACGGGLYVQDRLSARAAAAAHGATAEAPLSPLTAGGVDQVLPVTVYVPGSPPAPIAILEGLLLAAGLLDQGACER